MKKYPVGTRLMIENGGNGWRLISGYEALVVDIDNLIGTFGGFPIEGLQERTEDVFFVQIDDAIEELAEEGFLIEEDGNFEKIEPIYETVFDGGSVWAISLESKNAKVYEITVDKS